MTRVCEGTPVRPEVKMTTQFGEVHMKAAAGVQGCGTQLVEREYLGEHNERRTLLACPRCDTPDPANVLPPDWTLEADGA